MSLATSTPGPRQIHPKEGQSDAHVCHRVEQNLCRANRLSFVFNALVGPFAFSLVFYHNNYVRPSPQQQSLGEATRASLHITSHPNQNLRKAVHAPLAGARSSTTGGYYSTTIRQLYYNLYDNYTTTYYLWAGQDFSVKEQDKTISYYIHRNTFLPTKNRLLYSCRIGCRIIVV